MKHLANVFVIFLIFSMGCQSAKQQPTSTQSQTQKNELSEIESILTPWAEAELSMKLSQKMLQDYNLWYHHDFNAYLNQVGQHVSIYSLRPSVSYQFHVLDTQDLVSFGLPSGDIFVSLGLLSKIENESELAGLLGSEVAHVEHQHLLSLMETSNSQFQKNMLENQEALTKAYHVLTIYRFPDEYYNQADRLGMTYAMHFGYDPASLQQFYARLYQELIEKDKQFNSDQYNPYFLGHRESIGATFVQELAKHKNEFPKQKDQYKKMKKNLTSH